MNIQLDCKEVSRLISNGLDETLPASERARMRLHFAICETCRSIDEQMRFLRSAMRKMDEKEVPHGE